MRDPKAIRKAIMTAKSIASLVDPKFARVPLPDLGVAAPEVYVPEHSPAMHEAFGMPMPKGFAAGGEAGVLYRGTDPDSSERIQGGIGQGHLFATPHRDVAELYGSKISKMRLRPEAKVLVEGSPDFAAVTGRKHGPLLRTMRHGENLRDAANDAIEKALQHGYDAVEFNSMRDLGTAILNPNAVIHEDEPDHYASGGEVEDSRAAFLEGNHPLVPHVVYHGTDRNITQFDTEQPRRVDAGGGDTTDTGWYSKGHYFTPSPEAASNFASNYAVTGEHGPNVMPVHLSLKNPFIVKVPRHSSGATDMDTALDRAGAPRSSDERLISKGRGERLPSEQTKILRQMGHDGVIVMQQFGHKDEETARQAEERARMAERLHKEAADEYYDAFGDHDNPHRLEAAKDAFMKTRKAANAAREEAGGEYRPAEFVVFEPHQIKSASGNRGTFDRSNSDIRYASGGEVEDENPYTQPNDLGFYSHAAATAAELPQERGTPEQFRGMLLNKGVKPSEFEWSGYDKAFADQPQVTRQQIAEHFHANRPPVHEKRFQEGPTEPERKALKSRHLDDVRDYQQRAREEANFDPDGELWKRLQYWHQAEKRELESKYDKPHHQDYTIPGGENYREILLKHGGEEGFKGVPVHFKGEPNVLASLMVKDRQDTEGDKVLHVDELQSDWAQKGRQEGFKSPSRAAYQEYIDELKPRFEAKFRQDREDQGGPASGYDNMEKVIRMYQGDAASMAHYLGEEDKHTALVNALSKDREGPHGRAPYVTKTEDWVDLGLKRALREAAEGGYDKLAWSPGKTIADRYDLAKHVGDIHHEKNDDGTYNLIVRGHDGETILKEDDWEPKKVSDYFGKGVADRIFAGEGESGKEAYDKHFAARDRYNNFLDMAADKLADTEVDHLSGDDRERMHRITKKIYKEGLGRDPEKLLGEVGLLDDHNDLLWNLQDAEKALKEAPYYSPYRDWRRLSNLDLQVGEKWPFEMYDRMIHKRALRLAKMHDPEAKLEKSTITHKSDHDIYEFYPEDEHGNVGDEPANPASMMETDLHAIRITPKMRESILKKGFPAYAQGGEVEAYADGGEIDPEKVREALRRVYNPLSDNPEHVQHALRIAQTYKTPLGGETGTGSFYRIKQSMPVSAVTAKVGNIPGINLKPIKKGSWEDFYDRAKGGVMVNVGGDLSGFGRLTHINNKPLAWPIDLHAGADYMREPNKGRVWANIKAHATSFSNKIREAEDAGKEVFGVLSPMGPTAVDSSHNMFDALMAQIPGAEIEPEDLKAFDEAIKRGDHLEADDRKNPKIMTALQQWPGLESAKEVSDFARPSSKKITGANRAAIVKFMGQDKWQKKGFPEVGVTRVAISNPDLVGIGGNKLGYRIARLSSEPIHSGGRSFEHSTYPVDTHGEYLQDVPLVERHHATPDVTEQIITSPYKGGIVAHPYSADDRGRSTYRQLFEQQKQMQPVNQRMLDSIMTAEENKAKYGFKKGGSVRKALMIAKTTKKK